MNPKSGQQTVVWRTLVTVRRRTRPSNHVLSSVLALSLALALSAAARAGDFNGDGIDDLAVGVPAEGTAVAANAGAVNVIYGRGATFGLDAAVPFAPQFLTQSGLGEVDEGGDLFGFALAVGDFNGDKYDDLAIAAPNEATVAGTGVGMVIAVYGGPGGLNTGGVAPYVIFQSYIGGTSAADELFGFALAAGDFDGDGFDDLAIGAPNEDNAGLTNVGSVDVLYGSGTGLIGGAVQHFIQDDMLVGISEAEDHFGDALAAGDFDGNGDDDLAVGVSGEDYGATNDGVVQIVYGYGGLDPATSRYWYQGAIIAGVNHALGETAENDDHMGQRLAAGNFNDDNYDDLAIGVPDEDLGANVDTGLVIVAYGSVGGIQNAGPGPQGFHQNKPNMPETNGSYDRFGAALATGDFDANGADDLAIGQPGEQRGAVVGSGAVTVLYGVVATGLTVPAAAPYLAQLWDQNSTSAPCGVAVPEVNNPLDHQGAALATGDFDDDGYADLVWGAADEDIPIMNAGAVNVVYGAAVASGGLSTCATVAPELWRQSGIVDGAQPGDGFGASVASR